MATKLQFIVKIRRAREIRSKKKEPRAEILDDINCGW